MSIPSKSTRARLQRLFDCLDYTLLGELYCDEGGAAFWDAHREPALHKGADWAAALASRLSAGGRSLYVGAGVAELAALVTEACDLSRTVVATNLDGRECTSLNASLDQAGLGEAVQIRCQDAAAAASGFDHLSVVSVLNDPVNYPTVSAVGYGRMPPVLLDVAAFERERGVVLALVDRLLAGLQTPAILTTTYEEASWFLAAAEAHDLHIDADEDVVESAIVGDPIGFLRVVSARR